MMKPLILVTNDDGIFAPGIRHLWQALHDAKLGELHLIAPALERSGSAASITFDRPLALREIYWEGAASAWSVDGTPADCVKLGSHIILKRKPDLIISGINAGSNAGRNVLHSGTIGAVIEGALRGIPGIAFSCEDGNHPNFPVATRYIPEVVRYLMQNPLSPGCILNVNFPKSAEEHVKGFKLTRQGMGRWLESPYLHRKADHSTSYWMGGKAEESSEEPESDIALLREGYMTAVPLHVHELTHFGELEERKQSFEELFKSQDLVVKYL